jgi:hypothetical protein
VNLLTVVQRAPGQRTAQGRAVGRGWRDHRPGLRQRQLAALGLPELAVGGPFTLPAPHPGGQPALHADGAKLRALIVSAEGNGRDFDSSRTQRDAVRPSNWAA